MEILMNERIRQLYIQAINDTKHDPADDINIQIAEKFAELIVAEVIAVQENLIADGHNAWHLHRPTKKHFGVEV